MKIGAYYGGDGKCEFTVWAPFMKVMNLKIVYPVEQIIPMEKNGKGYWQAKVDRVHPGALYFYLLNNAVERPDPASFYQPVGVHGTSQVIDHGEFIWRDGSWQNIAIENMIIYELHTGTFTPEATFEAIIPRLADLKDIGVNTIEIMPVAQFPGRRNWGYDGTHLFAVQNSYGGPAGLKTLVDNCHQQGMAIILDVVYNHVGPEGNYLSEFGPYFTDRYKTPWGDAINYDGPYSDEVRNFFIQNALYWFKYYHVDALRLDAVHGIYDMNAKHILEELAEEVAEFSRLQGRMHYLIAESDLNDIRIIRQRGQGGFGIDAQWCDDFHHAVHTVLTGENRGYYADFGRLEDIQKSLNDGFVYSWRYSTYRKRHFGSSSASVPASQFIAFIQDHDQVGNRVLGERLSQLVPFEALKLAAGILIVSPYIPMLFMGEEYAEDNPFLYFINHSNEDLIRAVREGRRREFSEIEWPGEPPDPQSEETFNKSRLEWQKRNDGKHKIMLAYYKELITNRKDIPALNRLIKENLKVDSIIYKRCLILQRWYENSRVLSIMNFSDTQVSFKLENVKGEWGKILDSADSTWMGPGCSASQILKAPYEIILQPFNFLLYVLGDKS